MLQQAVVAYVDHQNHQLRQAAELRYLSFLSHDICSGLGGVTLWLKILRLKLEESPGFKDEIAALDTAQRAIYSTLEGMGRLLQAERLRHPNAAPPAPEAVDLHDLSSQICRQFTPLAEQKGLKLIDAVPPEAELISDRELIRLVLQNVVVNALKYSNKGTVWIAAVKRKAKEGGGWTNSVSDEGRGIAAEHLDRIFEAFGRGEMHGEKGIGLGLAIASRAAKLLGAD